MTVLGRNAAAAALVLALTLTACSVTPMSSDFPTSSPTSRAEPSTDETGGPVDLPTPAALAAGEQPMTCGSPLTFSAEALLGVPGAELADHPAAGALRALLAQDDILPDRGGWLIVALSTDDALFLLPATPIEEFGYWNAEFHRATAGWAPVRWGQCDVRPSFDGVQVARWELTPGAAPGPESTALDVLVYEQACASGESPEGRVVQAAITYGNDSVTVTLGTTPLPGGQTCQGGPPANYVVQLTEPLGTRQLLDGWVFPPEPRN